MKNPFFYGEAATGEFFTDRKAEIKSLCADLERGQNIIIFSPRRYGKTSLIKKALSILKQKGLLTIYVDLYAATSKKRFIEIYAQAIAGELETDLNKAVGWIKNLLPRIISKLVLKPQGLPEIEFEFKGTAKNISAILEDVYEALPKYLKKKKKRAVVVFDEFQEILNLEDEEIEKTLRSHSQFHHEIAYVFMGSKKHLILKLFNDANRPFYKSGKLFPLYKIKAEDFFIFLSQNFKKSKIKAEPALISQILEITECHPYYTQLLGSTLWDRCVDQGRITPVALKEAVAETTSRSAAIYIEIFDNLTGPQKRLLEALARSSGANLFSRDFIIENELGAASTIQRGLKSLQQKGIIDKENGSYIFSDIFFQKWIEAKS